VGWTKPENAARKARVNGLMKPGTGGVLTSLIKVLSKTVPLHVAEKGKSELKEEVNGKLCSEKRRWRHNAA